jgi:hypothetical protein
MRCQVPPLACPQRLAFIAIVAIMVVALAVDGGGMIVSGALA